MTETNEKKSGLNTKTARVLLILGVFGIIILVLKYGLNLELLPKFQ